MPLESHSYAWWLDEYPSINRKNIVIAIFYIRYLIRNQYCNIHLYLILDFHDYMSRFGFVYHLPFMLAFLYSISIVVLNQ